MSNLIRPTIEANTPLSTQKRGATVYNMSSIWLNLESVRDERCFIFVSSNDFFTLYRGEVPGSLLALEAEETVLLLDRPGFREVTGDHPPF